MSIIHEALKKVQERLTIEHRPKINIETTPAVAPQIKPFNLTIFLPWLGLVLIIIIGLLIVRFRTFIPILNTSMTVIKLNEPPKPLAKIKATHPESKQTTFNVHGVMSNKGTNVALINDKIYEAGDIIDDIKIITINLNSIVILKNGTEETIAVGK